MLSLTIYDKSLYHLLFAIYKKKTNTNITKKKKKNYICYSDVGMSDVYLE